MRTTKRGFTVLELMTTVVICGVLAAIAVPQYTQYTYKAKMSEAAIALGTFHRMAAVYQENSSQEATSIAEIGFGIPQGKFWDFSELTVTSKTTGSSNGSGSGKGKNTGATQGNGQDKQTICHGVGGKSGHTITVADPAVYNAHLAHGDLPSACAIEAPQVYLKMTSKDNIHGNCKKGSYMAMDLHSTTYAVIDSLGNCSTYLPDAMH